MKIALGKSFEVLIVIGVIAGWDIPLMVLTSTCLLVSIPLAAGVEVWLSDKGTDEPTPENCN